MWTLAAIFVCAVLAMASVELGRRPASKTYRCGGPLPICLKASHRDFEQSNPGTGRARFVIEVARLRARAFCVIFAEIPRNLRRLAQLAICTGPPPRQLRF
jgi:hypothetical protein